MSTYTIEPYSDLYKRQVAQFVIDILEREFGLTGIDRPDLSSIKETYQKNNGNFWIAMQEGRIVGTIALSNYGGGRGYLKRTYVARAYRGTGLARDLLNTLCSFAKDNGYSEIYLGTVPEMLAANKFYQREGFISIQKLPDDIPDFGDTIFYKRVL